MKVTVIPFSKSVSLAEIGQSMNLKFGVLRKESYDKDSDTLTLRQVTAWHKCRDFNTDVRSSTVEKTNFSIYGMSWDGKSETLDWDVVYLNLQFPNAAALNCFKKNLAKLHSIEEKNGVPPTQFVETENNCGVVMGPKIWLLNSMSYSLYTFLLRIFCYELKQDDWITEMAGLNHSDSKYVSNFPRKSLDAILNDLTQLKTDDWCGLSFGKDGTSAVHHNSGIVSIFSRHSEINENTVRKNKHWQEMRNRGFATAIK